jgi:peptidoglycan/LPS O-acetylase OafA/YrhL
MNKEPRIHLPGLNGIRAFAALVVVIHHTGFSLPRYGLPIREGIDLAGYGVTIFFALSGFLITYLLLVEKKVFSSINIKQFYIRRILRIWPLYYLYFGLFILTSFIEPVVLQNKYLIFTALFSANVPFILGIPMGSIAHFWSLGVEEQFYAFWPWVARKAKSLLRWVIAFIIIFVAAKIAMWIVFKMTGNVIPYMILDVTRFDCMAIGAYGAIQFHRNQDSASSVFLKMMFHPLAQLIAWASILLLAFNMLPIPSVVKDEFVSAIAVVIILNVAGNERSMIKLRGRILNFLGKISYGIYVYHMLIIFLLPVFFGSIVSEIANENLRTGFVYSVVPALTILVAFISYEYYEKPFLKLKGRFSRVISSPTN